MIDWSATEQLLNKPQNQVKNVDRVIIVCDNCNATRSITYLRAKKCDHRCMSCIKLKYKQPIGSPIELTCNCGNKATIGYRPGVDESWQCRSCILKSAHESGKYDFALERLHAKELSIEQRSKIGELSSERWLDQSYRDKWAKSRSATKESRSISSKQIWSDSDRLQRLSASIKYVWSNPDYRDLKSKQSQELWLQEDYKLAQAEGLNDIEVRDKIRQASLNRWQNNEYREKLAIARANQPRISTIQQMLYSYLDDLKISYYKEGTDTTVGHYVFDCLVPGSNGRNNLLIECHGDYWHSLPKSISNDRSKFAYIDRYFKNYEIMYVWEHEFYTEGRVLDRLKQKVGVSLNSVEFDFSDVILRKPDAKEVKSFLDSYHYIGKDRGGFTVGAYYNDILIACIVFSPPLRQNTAGQFGLADGDVRELSRLCIHPCYHKKNFASWFVSRSVKQVDTKLIIAYADRTVGHCGSVYKACNFELDHEVPADYWYTDSGGFVMHKRTLYGKAKQFGITEGEYVERFGYCKVWGGQKLCFTFKIA